MIEKKFTQGYVHVIYLSTSRDRTCFDFSVRTLKSKGCPQNVRPLIMAVGIFNPIDFERDPS